eukprot:10226392-Alexandrium_andersonii.AAC.1
MEQPAKGRSCLPNCRWTTSRADMRPLGSARSADWRAGSASRGYHNRAGSASRGTLGAAGTR